MLTVNKTDFWSALADHLGAEPVERVPIPDNPWEFVRQCCFTFDERAGEKGLDSIRPMPDKEYLRIVTEEWQRNPNLSVEKSRQIMVTWLFACLFLWLVLHRKAQRIAWFCLKRPLAAEHIRNRIYRMYLLIPSRFNKPYACIVNDEFRVYHDGPDSLPTSKIVPMAAEKDGDENAATQMRSETYSAAFKDESAFYRSQDEIHYSLLPCCGSVVDVSSANGNSFFHRRGYSDDPDTVSAKLTNPKWQERAKGVYAWDRNSTRHLRVHYSADPDKGPGWVKTEKARFSTRKWAREMEIDSSVAAGLPVYCDTDKIITKPQSYRPAFKLYRTWDFGFRSPVCLWFQVIPVDDVRRVNFLYEVSIPNTPIQEFAEKYVIPTTQRLFPGAQVEDFGDPAGHQRSSMAVDREKLSNIQVLLSLGINVITRASKIDSRVDLFQNLISMGCVEIDPSTCPQFLADIRGGYHRDDDGLPVKDDVHDHYPDAAGYGIVNLFNFDTPKNVQAGTVYRPTAAPSRPEQAPPRQSHTATVYRPPHW